MSQDPAVFLGTAEDVASRRRRYKREWAKAHYVPKARKQRQPRKSVPAVCETCGMNFLARIDSAGRYCSNTCTARRIRLVAVYRYRGGKLRHVSIASRVLGKPLPHGAQVHHVNGDGRDNRHTNLVICQDASYHRLLHVRSRVRDRGGDPNTQRICTTCKRLFVAEVQPIANRPSGFVCTPCGRFRSREYQRRKRSAVVAA